MMSWKGGKECDTYPRMFPSHSLCMEETLQGLFPRIGIKTKQLLSPFFLDSVPNCPGSTHGSHILWFTMARGVEERIYLQSDVLVKSRGIRGS